MELNEFARTILEGASLEEKLITFDGFFSGDTEDLENEKIYFYEIPKWPGRPKSLSISSQRIKFPKVSNFYKESQRALSLHFFANHELLAIEMMAATLLKFPTQSFEDIKFKKGLLYTLQDEQNHLRKYIERMRELGIDFGDYPVNGFFWEKMEQIKTPVDYLTIMSLTFEAANLDFAKYYSEVFESVDDKKSASLMREIYEDEISHVAFGKKWLSKWKGDLDLWDYYLKNLPWPLTPARAKGLVFDESGRRKAGLDNFFVENMKNYRDEFPITTRKQWKDE